MTFSVLFALATIISVAVYAVLEWYVNRRQRPLHHWNAHRLVLNDSERAWLAMRRTLNRREYARLVERSLANLDAEIARRGFVPGSPDRRRL